VNATSTAASAVLDVEALTISYATRNGNVRALRNVGFSIGAGETTALVGESGSGKSTVALAVMNLLPLEATVQAGNIRFAGRELAALAPAERRALRGNRIGIVFQDPFTSLNPSLPIGLQVAEPLIFHRGMSEAAAREKAIAALAEVGLSHPESIARAYPHQLSGGMQQRALIATALICDPDLVILDEPTTALDVTVEAAILDLLDELRRRRGVSMLFITHNLGLVNRICDSVCVLYAGSVLETGPTTEVLRRPAHPYTAGLLASMPRLDTAHRHVRLEPIAGKFPDLIDLPAGCVFHPRCAYVETTCRETTQALVPVVARHSVRCWKYATIADAMTNASTPFLSARAPGTRSRGTELLEVRDLHKSYPLPTRLTASRLRIPGTSARIPWLRLVRPDMHAVAGVTLSVSAGETLGLVGESGCGKSTLGRAIVRLIEPSWGTIVFAGHDVGRSKRGELRAFRGQAQIIFQNPVSSLNPRKTVGATIGRAIANFSTARGKSTCMSVAELLEQVGLSASYAERYPHQLSGGERQRVGIARALAPRPQFIACDEPVSALDVSVQATVLNLLADLRDRLGLAYLFISHDLAVVAHIADRIAVMYGGVICEEGTTDAVLAPPYHPYTEALLSAIPSADPARRRSLRILPRADPEAITRSPRGCCYARRCARKIGDVCDETTPPTVEAAPGHRIACHLPLAELRRMTPILPIGLTP
jgi:peptide/nickel transport system ATP-binding protein